MVNVIVLIMVFLGFGCGAKDHERVYEEIVIEAPIQNAPMMMDPHKGMDVNNISGIAPQLDHNALAWEVPSQWQEVPGSGMRVASFKNVNDPQAVDVSIVSLSGEAGGLESNLVRWALQIDIDLKEDPKRLTEFIDKAGSIKTVQGLDGQIFDFRDIQDKSDLTAKSLVASMVRTDDTTIFVKMTGTVKTIAENIESFKSLTRSLKEK